MLNHYVVNSFIVLICH